MNITIIGAGNMGRGIATRAIAGGHKVTFVDANPETAQKAAADLKAEAGTLDTPLGDVVVLAVWYGTMLLTCVKWFTAPISQYNPTIMRPTRKAIPILCSPMS